MPVRKKSALYNDPSIGAIFNSLGSMFAPPKATDAYAWAHARAAQQGIDLKDQAAAVMNDPNATTEQRDRAGALANLFNPTQGFGARDMTNATTRRGQDVTANTSITNNTANNVRAVDVAMINPVAAGATRFIPQKLQDLYGVAPTQSGNVNAKPGDRVFTPGPTGAVGDGVTLDGTAKPLTESEQKAIAIAALKPDEQRLVAMQGVKTGGYVGPGGLPITAFDTVAADQGMAPAATPVAPNPTARNYMTADGKGQGLMTVDGAGTPIDATTRQPLAPGAQLREIQGSAAETSIGAGPQNNVDQKLIDIQLAERASDDLLALVNSNEGSQGIVGQIRGTVQDTVASGTALGKLLKVPVAENLKAIQEGRIDPQVAAQLTNYDGSIPAITIAENNVIAHMAKLQSGDSRISNDRFNQLKSAVGSGWLGNADKTRAVLGQFKQSLAGQKEVLAPLSSDPAKLAPAAAAPAPVVAAPVAKWVRGPDGKPMRAQ